MCSPEKRGGLLDPLDGEQGGRRQRGHGRGGGDGLHTEVHDERGVVVGRHRDHRGLCIFGDASDSLGMRFDPLLWKRTL